MLFPMIQTLVYHSVVSMTIGISALAVPGAAIRH